MWGERKTDLIVSHWEIVRLNLWPVEMLQLKFEPEPMVFEPPAIRWCLGYGPARVFPWVVSRTFAGSQCCLYPVNWVLQPTTCSQRCL